MAEGLGYPVAYENRTFNPDGLKAWLAVYFMPTTSEGLSTTADDERGIFQISVFVPSDSDDFDTEQLIIIDKLKAVFYTGSGRDGVTILDVNTNSGQESSGWFKRDLSINYSSYIKRG